MVVKTEQLTLSDVIRQLYDEGLRDEEEFPGAVLGRVLYSDDPEAVLLPVLRSYTLSRLRGLVRAMEHEAFRQRDENSSDPHRWVRRGTDAGNVALRDRLNGLLDQNIWIPAPYAARIKWGSATVEMLEARAGMYRRQRADLDAAIADLTDAINAIRSVPDATCLNDVFVRGVG